MTDAAKEAIAAANKAFMAAFANGDAAGIAALYTEDGQVAPPSAEVMTGREALQEFWGMVIGMGLKSVKLETAELELLGEAGIEQGYYELGAGTGKVADRGKYLVVWKRVGGEWMLHRDIWNSSVPAP